MIKIATMKGEIFMSKVANLATQILEQLGSKDNVMNATHCMTRLRVNVHDRQAVNVDALKAIEGVLGVVADDTNYVQVILGPTLVRDVTNHIFTLGVSESSQTGNVVTDNWKQNKEAIAGSQKESSFKKQLAIISDIFTPMIPAFIASGVCNGLGRLIRILMKSGTIPTNMVTELILNFIVLIGSGFLAYLVIFTGVNAAKQFNLNPMLGGMIGAAALDKNVEAISKLLGWFNEKAPTQSILSPGAGGIIGVIVGVWLLAKIEKWVHDRMPGVLDISFTPLVSMLIAMPIYVLVIMPITGVISVQIANFLGLFINSNNIVVSIITGYILAATFLPLVLVGLHRGLTPIYTLQIDQLGKTTLFPAVAMAGAGQVGAAIALYIKAKRLGNKNMQSIIAGAIPAGILGIGEPLIYGVTLPLVKPFITAGLGAGFGGAYVLAMGTGSAAFSPSGILAVTHVLPELVIHYVIGIFISYIMGAIITYLFISDDMVKNG